MVNHPSRSHQQSSRASLLSVDTDFSDINLTFNNIAGALYTVQFSEARRY